MFQSLKELFLPKYFGKNNFKKMIEIPSIEIDR